MFCLILYISILSGFTHILNTKQRMFELGNAFLYKNNFYRSEGKYHKKKKGIVANIRFEPFE